MIEVAILIPLADNSKQSFDAAHHAAFEQLLVNLFGGFQLASGTTTGQWMDAGTVYADELRVYTVAVKGLMGEATALAKMVEFAKAHYGQLAVYVRYLNISEIL
jgi:histidine ammonia-lyase